MIVPRPYVAAWLAADPDPVTQAELTAVVAAGDDSTVNDRFSGRLAFGTAGLRAEMGAGPMRMNRLVVRQTAWGIAHHLLQSGLGTAPRGVVIGYDARRNSAVFAMDSARVFAAHGVPVALLADAGPTPLLAFATRQRGAAAGVMVTASHNPPADNGYKVFLADGSQIVSPHDVAIARSIEDSPLSPELAPVSDPLITTVDRSIVDDYLSMLRSSECAGPLDAPATSVVTAYTPLHGVAGQLVIRAFEQAGLRAPVVVAEQFEPDGAFPTVAFPNPEEPGAMDRVIELARSINADLALANDPDGDRLGVAIPTRSAGGWRMLTGDEIGALLADYVLAQTSGNDRLVVTTLVSSTLLGKMATAAGVHYAESFTGFKWIADAVRRHPELRFVFGYEQALGYLVTPSPVDKDGIGAAVAMSRITAAAKVEGRSIEDLLDDLATRFGRHRTTERSVRLPPVDGRAAVAALRANPPETLAEVTVTEVTWFDEAGLLRLQCGPNARVQVRPSGTEPKVKVYAEVVDGDPGPLADAVTEILRTR
jgi:phosphomannomutase